jgi:transposase
MSHKDGGVVALKLINTTTAQHEPYRRFMQEVQFLQKLDDFPGVLPLLDAHLPERPKSVFPTFVRILLSALAVGMTRGHDHHRRHPGSRPAVAGDPAAAAHPSPRYGGLPRSDDRAALAGIIYQLRTGVPWRLLPTGQLGCGSPITCWRRLRDWQRAGVWQRLRHMLLDQLGRDGRIDWSRASLDALSVRAKRGAR